MPLDTRQQKWLPLGLNTQACVQDTATVSSRPGIPFPELGEVYAAEHQFRYLQLPFQALLSGYDQQSCGKQASSLNWRRSNDAAPEGALKSSQKRFLILDQSGKQTRLLQFPLRFPSSVAAEPGKILDSLNPENGLSKDHAIPVKILLREDHVEKCYNGGEESEMHEDTEEIDALLYSDDEDNDDCDSDDEVMSTGHSPFLAEQQACDKTREELVETESSDDGPRCKRQKLLDHSYRDPSPSYVGTKSFTKLKGLSDDKLPESNISSKQETGSGLSEEQSRKDKMYIALRILESVVPGAKGKEALVLLDEAIDYLKLLKRNLNSSKDW